MSGSREPRFKCQVGGEWLPITEFSSNQRRLVDYQMGRGTRANTVSSGMICRRHVSTAVLEIRCELCHLIKPEDEFSKSSKKKGENVCKRCVAWDETQEPEVTPVALETGHVSVEEHNKEVWNKKFLKDSDFFPGAKPTAPVCDTSTLGLEDVDDAELAMARSSMSALTVQSQLDEPASDTQSEAGTAAGSNGPSHAAALPPHLGRGRSAAASAAANSEAGSSILTTSDVRGSSTRGGYRKQAGAAAGNVPPHLRKRLTPAASTDGYASSEADSVSTATTMRDERMRRQEAGKVEFNAWGPDGRQRQAIKTPTEASTADQNSVRDEASEAAGDDDGEGWHVATGTKGNRGKGKWHKAPRLAASELRQQPNLTHITTRHADPAVEEQRRARYCQSDDSRY
ncbi:stc1 domain-containing protein [Purpureocillium lavendulum]|uniref:Stc1 domain-containing protein n=1 Tax=Purpureocillium lavendulum TaxID=1247861 RepID=A0AB34FNJ4_9HYPO|nr:stc1 domain-containing protein [Purpureocillium lavendulum]